MRTPRAPFRSRILPLATVAIMALGVGACSGDDKEPKEPKEPDALPTVAQDPSRTTDPSGPDGGIIDAEGAIDSLGNFSCGKKGRTWRATGTVTNDTDTAATFLIRVAVHSSEAGTVFGEAEKKLDLKPGKKAKVTFDDLYSGKEKKVSCTPRVVRGN